MTRRGARERPVPGPTPQTREPQPQPGPLTTVPSVARVSAPRTIPPCRKNGAWAEARAAGSLAGGRTSKATPQIVVPVLMALGSDRWDVAASAAFLRDPGAAVSATSKVAAPRAVSKPHRRRRWKSKPPSSRPATARGKGDAHSIEHKGRLALGCGGQPHKRTFLRRRRLGRREAVELHPGWMGGGLGERGVKSLRRPAFPGAVLECQQQQKSLTKDDGPF